MPPVEITFHSRPPAAQHTKLQKGAKSRIAPGRTLYFTVNHGSSSSIAPSDAIPAAQPPTSIAPQLTTAGTQSKRAKPKAVAPPTQSASLTPLLQPIVSRCLARAPPGTVSGTSTPTNSPPPPTKRGLGHKNPPPATSTSQHQHPHPHPYSRLSDTKNNRSTVPSPREIARAQQAELDKIRVREESAAAARAAAAAKRKKGKSRASSKATPRGTTSVSPTKDEVPVVTTTEAPSKDKDSSPPAPLPPRIGLKRTRSTGLGISVGTANNIAGNPVVGSPLRSVTGPFDEDSDPGSSRKRSRLGESTPAGPGRRANSHSPHTDLKALPPPDDSRLLKTEPLAAAQLLPSTAMRRASSTGSALGIGAPLARNMSRTGSTGSVGSERERSRRETTLPGRLRDYDTV